MECNGLFADNRLVPKAEFAISRGLEKNWIVLWRVVNIWEEPIVQNFQTCHVACSFQCLIRWRSGCRTQAPECQPAAHFPDMFSQKRANGPLWPATHRRDTLVRHSSSTPHGSWFIVCGFYHGWLRVSDPWFVTDGRFLRAIAGLGAGSLEWSALGANRLSI